MITTIDAQRSSSWESYLEQIQDMDDFESISWDDYTDILTNLSEHPININTATREDLEQFPFLTAQQIEDIQAYIYQYGQMKSLGEIAMIESIGYYQRQLLSYFVYPGEITSKTTLTLKNILKYGKHEIVGSMKIPFYERKGDKNGYLGYKYKHWFRYNFTYGQNVKFGILGSQDAGEPFMSQGNYPYDFYSFYFQLRNFGKIKNITLGRYRVHFGLGLTINNDFGLGKTITLTTLGRNSNAIRTHSSRSSANYLQGAATTISLLHGLDVSAFISYRNIDATLNTDNHTIATIVKTGYHRTQNEINKKDNASTFLCGTNIRYFKNGYHIGATALYTSFNKPLAPKTNQIYRRWYPQGASFYNMSIDYGYTSNKLTFSGETAINNLNALATLNLVSYAFNSNLSLITIQRFYSYKYYSLYSQSFNDGGAVQNESGIYLGINWQPWRKLTMMAYTDYAYFPWARYRTSMSSTSWDTMLSGTLLLRKPWNINFRYRYRVRQINNSSKTALINQTEQHAKLAVNSSFKTWNNTLEGNFSYSKDNHKSFGWMIAERSSVDIHFLRLYAGISYFHTQDFNSRVYAYEQGPLYTLSFPSFYGEGIHYMLMTKANINSHLMVLAKVGTTNYFDRNHISSSYQQINQSAITDLDIQVKWKF